MQLKRVRLRNFRCYETEIQFEIDNLTVFVGRNECGKSSLFDALAIFFEEVKIDSDDACISGDNTDVSIICEFEDLPENLVIDADHPTNLKDEYLLNENDRLEIRKTYNCSLKTPKVSSVCAYSLHPSSQHLNDLLSLKITQLRDRAQELEIDTDGVDLSVSSAIRKRLWSSSEDLQLTSNEIPLDLVGTKQIWDQLKLYMPSYALFRSDRPSTDQDAEAQDPMKAAVKEALQDLEDQLNSIAQRVEDEVGVIAEKTVEKLKEMHPALANELKPRFSKPNWASVFKISLTGDDDVPINKRGSGVRRLILLNFFRAKAEQIAAQKNVPNVIYAIEEPETSQHPDNQRLLLQALQDLSDDPDCQVLISTHTPTLARLVPADNLRYISIEEDGNRVEHSGSEETYELISKALGVLPDHDVKLFIGIEGINDEAFLKNISRILVDHGEEIIDLDQLDRDGEIVFFPLGGTNLTHWVSRLKNLNRPEYYIFDRDNPPPENPNYQAEADAINAREGCVAVHTGKREMENYIHPQAIRSVNSNVVIAPGDFDDVPSLVAEAIHENSESPIPWSDLNEDQKGKKVKRAKKWLNLDAVLSMTPALLDQQDQNGDVRNWLQEMQDIIENGAR